MALRYKQAGEALLASDLNRLTDEMDRALRVLFGGHSPLVYGANPGGLAVTGFPEGKRFYFGDSASWRILSAGTEYNHATYTAAAAALSVVATDTDLELAWCEELTWTLDDSLEAHRQTVTVNGRPLSLYLANRDATTKILTHRERHRKFSVAEIIVEAWNHSTEFEWADEWNKYHFLRFHNLDSEALRIRLPGGVRFTIRPFGAQAVRRAHPVLDNWAFDFRYLWGAVSGDLLVLDGVRENNVASLMLFHDLLTNFESSTFPSQSGSVAGFVFDPRVHWNYEDGTFPRLAENKPIFQYAVHLGDALAVKSPTVSGSGVVSTIPSWDRFTGPLGWDGMRFDGSTGITSTVGAWVGSIDVVGVGTDIAPKTPVALPHDSDASTVFQRETTFTGVSLTDTEVTGTYQVELPGPVFVPTDVTVNYDAPAETNPGWNTVGTLGLDNALFDIGKLEAVSADEATTRPTVSFATDGWNLWTIATVRIPAAFGHVPAAEDLMKCDITSNHFDLPHANEHRYRATDGNWQITTARRGRKLSPHVGYDDGATVTYQGHPDVTGEDGLAGGIDFEHARGTPTESAVARLESVGALTDTLTLPVAPLGDSVDRIISNIPTRGWYATNRAALMAGTLALSDKQKNVRIPIVREHYNHIAQRLNALVRIVPFQFRDALWWGDIEDGTEPSWTNGTYSPGEQPLPQDQNHPAGFYCAVLSSGARHAEIGGMPRNSVTVGGVTSYYLSTAIVAHRAQLLGFRFLFERLTAARRAETDDSPTVGGLQWWPETDWDAADWRDYRTDGYLVADFVTLTGYGLIPPAAFPNSTDAAPSARWERYLRDPSEPVDGWGLSDESRLLTVPRPIVQYSSDPMADNPTSYPGNLVVLDAVAAEADIARLWTAAQIGSGSVTAASIAALHSHTMADARAGYQVLLASRLVYSRA